MKVKIKGDNICFISAKVKYNAIELLIIRDALNDYIKNKEIPLDNRIGAQLMLNEIDETMERKKQ